MSLRFDDAERVLTLSVRDLVELGFRSGHLSLDVVRSAKRRMAEGRAIHEAWQADRAVEDEAFEAEKTLKHRLQLCGWTVDLQGRVDGLTKEGGTTIVEEVKSVALPHGRLFQTEAGDYASYVAQLEIYLWMLVQLRHNEPVGRLVLVSLVDGAKHVLGVTASIAQIDGRVRSWLERVLRLRDDRIDWLRRRSAATVPWPFDGERPGQGQARAHVLDSLDGGRTAMVQAPTGLGKTAAVMVGALRHALSTGRQVFWATARTTQQSVAIDTARRLVEAGLPLRVVVITAKDKVCLNDVVSCRPEACPFAHLHYDKVDEDALMGRAWAAGLADRDIFQGIGRQFEVCPYQLASDVARNADLIIGDYNYAFDPDLGSNTLFGESLERWVVVVDEAHQLVERARGYGSPGVDGAIVRRARSALSSVSGYERFVELCDEISGALAAVEASAAGPWESDEATVEVDARPWRRLVESLDDVAVDYGVLKAEHAAFDADRDDWLDVARSVFRFADAIDRAGPETVSLVRRRRGVEVRLLCLDPSGLLKPRFEKLGGAVLCSATLCPSDFYEDLLGLRGAAICTLPSPFPPENCRVLVAPRVSTRYRDRSSHAPRTSALLQSIVRAVPGNVALYFPSFAMLDDLVDRIDLGERRLLRQERGLSEAERARWLSTLRQGGQPTVLAAVLGGLFAEGIDLPGGALQAAVIVGPALPPIGLERRLLREYYEERYQAGYRYASLIPGMTKVIQAAGRVVRGPNDRGVVVLVGRRFRWREHEALLPSAWQVETPEEPVAAVRAFFEADGAGGRPLTLSP
ncbi:MAG: helicase C-terminal domain-containing protein [Myxococcota bacterium]